MVLALHTVSGQIADVSPKMLQHPHFKKYLVPVGEGQKPYNPVMYKGGTVEEKTEDTKSRSFLGFKKKDDDVVESEETESNIDIEEEN